MSRKRWLYLCVGTLVLLFLGLIYAWSIFRKPFGEVYPGWSIGQLSMTFTISIVCFCLGGFLGGQLGRFFGARTRMIIAAVLLFAGFFAVSRLDPDDPASSLTRLYIFYGAFGGLGVGIGYNALIPTIARWFPDKPGLTNGIMLMGFGLGGLLLGTAVNSMIASHDLFYTFRMLAFSSAAVLALGALIIHEPSEADTERLAMDEDIVSKVKHEGRGKKELESMVGEHMYRPGEMIRTSRFWLEFLWSVMQCSAGLMVINSAADISIAFGGSAVLGMVISLFNGAGRIVSGSNFDRRGRRTAMIANVSFMLLAGVLLIAGSAADSLVLVVLGLIFTGLSYGGTPAINATYVYRMFGPKYFSMNQPFSTCSLLPSAFIGPVVSSALLERSGGSYSTNFVALLCFGLASLVVWMLLNRACRGHE